MDSVVMTVAAQGARRPEPAGSKSCVLLPAYNVERTVGPLVRQIKKLGFDPIVVNDGSTDRTAREAVDGGAFVVSHVRNRGKGQALRSGFAYAMQAGYDPIVTMDSDGQHDPQDLQAVLEAARHSVAGILIGQRQLAGDSRMPLLRKLANRVMSSIVSSVAGQAIPDSQSGFRVIRRELLHPLQLSASHFDLETELLLAACKHGWTVQSVPIRTIYEPHHGSHIQPLADGWRFFRVILRYAFVPSKPRGAQSTPLAR